VGSGSYKITVGLLGAIVSAAIGLALALNWPRIQDDWKQFTGPSLWRPTLASWAPVQQTAVRTGTDGSLQLTSPSGYMRWFGAYIPDPRLCDYRLTLDARSSSEPGAAAYGYGIAPGVILGAAGVPQGPGVQYDHAFNGLRYPDYPYDNADNQSGYIDPETTFADGTTIPINDQWNHWTVVVRGSIANVSLDGHKARPLSLNAACTGGIYLRVWNGTAYFRNIVISKP